MPPTKNALLRYAAIDTCLQRTGRRWRFTDLHEAVSAAYNDYSGADTGISIRTLREDLKNMRPGGATGYDAPIVADSKLGYYYEEEGFSIFNSPLSVDDLIVLQGALGALKQLQGLGLSQELAELVERLELRLSYPNKEGGREVLQFELLSGYQGQQWLGPLYKAIRDQQAQWLTYQSFRASEPQREVIHPYLLKQYNGRWFLVAQREGRNGDPSVFALDRIQSLALAPNRYQVSEHEPTTFFTHLLGVSILPQAELQKIRLRFAKSRLPYVLTKPLHSSQEVEQTNEGPLVCLTLVPTRELLTLLLSFGADLEVIEPRKLRVQLRDELKQALENYTE